MLHFHKKRVACMVYKLPVDSLVRKIMITRIYYNMIIRTSYPTMPEYCNFVCSAIFVYETHELSVLQIILLYRFPYEKLD